MSYYVVDNSTNYPQYSRVRRNGYSFLGLFVVHTWESAPDWIGPDTGLENALPWLRNRRDPGSYHFACDSDSDRDIVPWRWEAWQCRITNNWSVGGSIATQAHKWPKAPAAWREAAIRRMARRFAEIADEYYRETKRDIPARWLNRDQAVNKKMMGFVRHGTTDPGRRSDPWPENAPEAPMLLAYYKAHRTTGQYAKSGGAIPKPRPNPSAPKRKHLYADATVRNRLKASGIPRPADGLLTTWVVDYQKAQRYAPGLIADGVWGPATEGHYQWTRLLQRTMKKWQGVKDTAVDGWYGGASVARVKEIMQRNHGGAYKGILDWIPGPVFCEMLDIPIHPGLR